jgi:hypothetical protein
MSRVSRHGFTLIPRSAACAQRSRRCQRLVGVGVPHVNLWKSAKWLRRLTLLDHGEPGFWETFGYHNYGDPWRKQRYSVD